MNFTTQYGAYTWGTSKFMYLFEPIGPIFKVGSYSIPSKKTSLFFAQKFAIFQLILIHFLEFFLMCDRQKWSIFFKLTTANIQICYYQKIKVNVIFDDISGFCLDICKLSTDSESSHLKIFLEVIRSNGGFFFHFSTLLALKISARYLEICNFFPDSTYIYQVCVLTVLKIHGGFS